MPKFAFRLFVAGEEARHQVTIQTFRQICDRHVCGRYELTVIDVLSRPDAADHDRVLATPTLLRVKPGPVCRIVGNICDERVLVTELGLDE